MSFSSLTVYLLLENELATYRRKQIVVEADVDKLLDENLQENESGLKKLHNKIKKLQQQSIDNAFYQVHFGSQDDQGIRCPRAIALLKVPPLLEAIKRR